MSTICYGQAWNPGQTTIGLPVIGGTSQSVLYVDSSGKLAQSPSYFSFNPITQILSITDEDDAKNTSIGGSEITFNADAPLYIKAPYITTDGGLYTFNGGAAIASYDYVSNVLSYGTGLTQSNTGVNNLPLLTASRPLKLDSSKNITASQINLASTNDVTGTLPVGNGGTGTSTAFTAGSVIFAGSSGTYTQDNSNLYFDDTNNRLVVGSNTVLGSSRLTVNGDIYVAPGSNNKINFDRTDTASYGRLLFLTGGTEAYGLGQRGDDAANYFSLTGPSANSFPRIWTVVPGSGSNSVTHFGTASSPGISLTGTGAAVFNEQGNAVDFRVETDSYTNVIQTDGTNNRIGFFTSPSYPVEIKPPSSGTPYYINVMFTAPGTNDDISLGLTSTRLSTTQRWFFGSGSGGSPNTNNFRIYDLNNSVEAINIVPGGTVLFDGDNTSNAKAYITSTGDFTATGAIKSTRFNRRVNTVVSSATPSINTDTTDVFTITALAANITSFTTNLSGTPIDGQQLTIRILDNGTARTITWGSSFISSGATLPTTTTASKYLYVGFIYNSARSKWDCVSLSQEA